MDFKEILNKLSFAENLTRQEAEEALNLVMQGDIEDSQIAAFLTAMRMKGETVDELTGFVQVMRNKAVKVNVDVKNAIDLVGTGGDKSNTFNISTVSSFIVAGAGVPVIKHGNRSASSKCGSADVLEHLGAVIELDNKGVEHVFNEVGMAFMFAPMFHPAMKYVMPARKALGFRTFFNILGPMANPAGVRRYVIGTYNQEIAVKIANILANLETEFAYTFNSMDGLDELSVSAESEVYELNKSEVSEMLRFSPESLGFGMYNHDELKGGGRVENGIILKNILNGNGTNAQRDITLLNATFAIQASSMAKDFKEAKQMAMESLDSGNALKVFNNFVAATNEAMEAN